MLHLEVGPVRLDFEAGVERMDVQKEVACAVAEPFLSYL